LLQFGKFTISSKNGEIKEHILFSDIDPRYIPEDMVEILELKRGESLFFNTMIPHFSPDNLSDKRRCAFIARYGILNIF
jgi:ectoine hydroxylase-related dioxygenase (phytanoyl-CoA dioxygenase family)